MLHAHKKYLAVIAAAGALALSGNVYADNTTDFSITVNPSVSLSISAPSVNLQITPTQSGVYDSDYLTVSASTNNTTGYTLNMTTTSTALVSNTPNLVTNQTPTIPSIAESQEGITAAAFEASTDSNILNHWGLAIDSGNFNAIKASQTIKTTNANISNDTTTLTMASKLDLLTVPGVYSTTLNFQLTANPLPDTLDTAYGKAQKQKTTIGGQDYYAIQDMNSTICADVDVIPSTLQVYDNRDNTIYTIGKLIDGHCWLLDNLALDLTAANASASITASNTNADATSLEYLFGAATRDWETDPDGNYATAGVRVLNSWVFDEPLIYADYKDMVYPSDPIEALRSSKYGVYYNYCAASAGSYCYSGDPYDKPNTLVDMEYDICPTGWHIPSGGIDWFDNYYNGLIGEYENVYNIIHENEDENSTDNLFRETLRIPLSGYPNIYGDLLFAGEGKYNSSSPRYYHWTATYYDSEDAEGLVLYTDGTINIGNWPRHYAFSVRCIAK